MPGYTPPAGNAVNFNYTVPIGGYSPPAGSAVVFDFNNNTGYTLTADPGVYVLAGTDPSVAYGRVWDLFDELIVNGEFTINTSGWTVVGDGGVTFNEVGGDGQLTIPAGATGGYAYQLISVTPGEVYRLEVAFGPGINASPQVQIGTHPGYDDIYTLTGISGVQSIDFVADTSSVAISLAEVASTSTTTRARTSSLDLLSIYTIKQLASMTISELLAALKSLSTTTTTTSSIDVARVVNFNKVSFQASGGYIVAGTDLSFAHGYAMTLGGGTYSLTGAAITPRIARLLDVASGSYALTGSAVGLLQGHLARVSSGTYNLIGAAVSLAAARVLGPAPGVYTLTGSSTLIMRKYIMSVGSGVYVRSSPSVSLLFGHKLKPLPGVYELDGTTLAFTYHEVTKIVADAGLYTLTGGDVTFLYGHRLAVGPGAYLVQGRAPSLQSARLLSPVSGTYADIGTDITLSVGGMTLGADRGVYTLKGGSVSMTVSREMTFGSGSYAFVGSDVTIRAARYLEGSGTYQLLMPTADPGYLLDGSGNILTDGAGNPILAWAPASVVIGRKLTIAAGTYSLVGRDAGLVRAYHIYNSGGVYTVVGAPVSLRAARTLAADPHAYQLVWGASSATYKRLTGGPRAILLDVAASRVLPVGAQNRILAVSRQNRVIGVPSAPSRVIGIPAEARELDVSPRDAVLAVGG